MKHALNTEVLYFGPTFERKWPAPEELVPADGIDPQADRYATAMESAAGLPVDRLVWVRWLAG